MAIYAGLFQSFRIGLRVAAERPTSRAVSAISGIHFAATVADEHEFDVLLKRGHVRDIRYSDAATTENANVGKLVQVRQSDPSGLHAAHGEPGHRTMGLIRNRAIGAIDPGDQVVDEDPLKCGEIEHPTSPWRRGVR